MKEKFNFNNGIRSAVLPTPADKTRITIRLDNDIIDWFRGQVERNGGGNYQTMINDVLSAHIGTTFLDFDVYSLTGEVIKRGLPESWFIAKLRDTDFNEVYDNILGDGECTWCEYEFSGDGTDSWLMQRCEFHRLVI